ncbi:hypothetical protein [Devosia salina]|uniref:Uncharacterized protein n=1 Tax=Devosia salina TaxID=2860336 RepID=A0ABX8WG72_9HYPH|nr:hypothetical protein [Devosia salina]QYO77758.1 hypothetical protein K1X15_04095 [Devosia salina]
MADAILGADAPARKRASSDIPHTRPIMVLDGLVADPRGSARHRLVRSH